MSGSTMVSRAGDTLTDEELVALARGGDDAALNALLARFRPVVRATSRRYYLAGGDRDDLAQEGMIGLYKAVMEFDATRQPCFAAFARLCVTRQMFGAIKAANRHKHAALTSALPLSAPVDDEEQTTLGDRVIAQDADPADHVLQRADVERLRAYCEENLSDLERAVLGHHSAGHNRMAIAKAVGRHVKAVDNALQRTRRKLELYSQRTSAA